MGSLFKKDRREELVRRVRTLRPDSARRWGRMTPNQAVCHLSDSFKGILGDRPVRPRPGGLRVRVARFLAFSTPMPWPKGVRTTAEMDAERGGSSPSDFEVDVQELESLIQRFADTDGRGLAPHHVWGSLSRGEWGRYGYRHVDHHPRQFSVD